MNSPGMISLLEKRVGPDTGGFELHEFIYGQWGQIDVYAADLSPPAAGFINCFDRFKNVGKTLGAMAFP